MTRPPRPTPATWLARWRQATGNADLLPKAPQALIAALNPAMIAEAETLDGATFRLHPGDAGPLSWSLLIPHDDGTFAALATALALTDGDPDPDLAPGIPVDRLDAKGTILAARAGTRLAFAGTRAALREALGGSSPRNPNTRPGLALDLDSDLLAATPTDPLAQLGRALRGAGFDAIHAHLALEADALTLEAHAPLPGQPASSPINLAWLETIPVDAPFAFALSVDTHAISILSGLAAGFLPDAQAPPRARLSALALAAGVVPEFELWPSLRGLSGFLLLDPQGRPHAGLLTLHTRDVTAARRLAERVLPRLLPRIGTLLPSALPNSAPLDIAAHGPDVLIAWNQPAARPDAAHSLRQAPWLLDLHDVDHVLVLAPARLLAARTAPHAPWTIALEHAPPLVIQGRRQPDLLITLARWDDLRGTVRRLIAATPQRPTLVPAP